ncbi:MAG: DUF4258 domain-containing protein [Chloroflexi bacterium]|nr:DUF4258 domain-containing protein [Chloroflexota bacterium]
MDIIRYIQERVRSNRYEVSRHAEREREDDRLSLMDIEESVLLSGELLEDYPNDPRGHSCLILGFNRGGQAVHTVWGVLATDWARLITVYVPRPPKWVDPRTRGVR